MSLKTQLTDDMKQAMRDRDSLKLNTIRFILAEIKNFEIDNGEQDDAGVQALIAKQVKQFKDAMTDFSNAGRTDLVAEEEKKIAVMESYLPQQMSDAELKDIVTQVVADLPAEQKNMGAVISKVRDQVAGRADGGRIASLVKELLA